MARSLLALLAAAVILVSTANAQPPQGYYVPSTPATSVAAAPLAPVVLAPGPGAKPLASGSLVHLQNGQAARILIQEEAEIESEESEEESEEDQFE